MGILIGLWQQAKQWDTPTKTAFSLALLVLIACIAVLLGLPQLQTPALIGVTGGLLALQAIALWGNRHMVTPYTRAQGQFLAGEMAEARDTLLASQAEREAADKSLPVDSLILLGNVYRNLGQLDDSLAALRRAAERRPNYHFALYGLGRSLLAAGNYDGAVVHLAAAHRAGAPEIVALDLAHAEYRCGNLAEALEWLQQIPDTDEAARKWLHLFLMHKLEDSPAPSREVFEAGLPFWEAEAKRFAATPYGQAVRADLDAMQALIK